MNLFDFLAIVAMTASISLAVRWVAGVGPIRCKTVTYLLPLLRSLLIWGLASLLEHHLVVHALEVG